MDKNAKRNNAHHRKNSHTHVFAGLLECKSCGRAYLAHSDRPRKDGWRPSTYRCTGRRDFHDCDSSMTGDVKISDFIINYLAKYIRENNGDEEVLSSNAKIKKPSNTNLSYEKEKEKYKRALSRLEDLYLFDDESMSEKDYILKKKKIEDKLKEIDKEIKNSKTTTSNEIDLSVLNSDVILKNEILNSEYINYKELDMLVDRKVLKQFVNSLVEKIIINHDGTVKSIKLKNGYMSTFS